MKALISTQENNRICEVVANTKTFPVADPLYWVDCPDDCTPEWTFDEGIFSPPAPKPIVIPEVVSMRQARLALLQVGLLSDVEAAIAQGTQADQITWEYATEVRRDDPLVINLGPALGLSSSQLDSLFLLASTL